ncbi:MAG TPA: phosphate acyltransferase PlsX [Balneolaceae bacterium]|nr:phosphate acyltransferase PlsX [Balneolaceae bacterium]
MIIAVDAVGGDYYPESTVSGAVEAVKERPELEIILTGPQQTIDKELEKYSYDKDRISVCHAPQIIGMNEEPAQAVKTKQKSSIVTGLKLHEAGECDGFISAGNTGALLAASTFILGKLDGVSRPSIAAIYPTVKGPRLLIDAGANLEMRSDMYVQFALMACIYAEKVMGIKNPSTALLNVGEENGKGTKSLKKVFKLLQDLPNFIGNVEGHDILVGKADVFVCNGLVGNLLLKLGESVPHVLKKLISSRTEHMQLTPEQKELIFDVLNTSLHKFNPDNVGGVPFLGIDGVSMVGHGGSTATAIKNMIFNAVKCVENNINDEITASLNS